MKTKKIPRLPQPAPAWANLEKKLWQSQTKKCAALTHSVNDSELNYELIHKQCFKQVSEVGRYFVQVNFQECFLRVGSDDSEAECQIPESLNVEF